MPFRGRRPKKHEPSIASIAARLRSFGNFHNILEEIHNLSTGKSTLGLVCQSYFGTVDKNLQPFNVSQSSEI
jgi:hypothetical protein